MPAILVTFLLLPVLAALVLAPLYAGMCAGLLALYGGVVWPRLYDPGYVAGAYESLANYWQAHPDQAGFADFLLPAFGPPLAGLLLGCALVWLLARYLKRAFAR